MNARIFLSCLVAMTMMACATTNGSNSQKTGFNDLAEKDQVRRELLDELDYKVEGIQKREGNQAPDTAIACYYGKYNHSEYDVKKRATSKAERLLEDVIGKNHNIEPARYAWRTVNNDHHYFCVEVRNFSSPNSQAPDANSQNQGTNE